MDPLPRLSPEFCHDDSPEEQSAACYDSAEEAEASRHQVLWANTMDEGRYQNPSLYEQVEVLLLCWKVCDMDTTSEVDDLRTVLEVVFGYHATTEYLDANSKQKLQVQVNARVAKFVEDCDGPNTLLIVYYAGHGRPGEFFGELELAGYAFLLLAFIVLLIFADTPARTTDVTPTTEREIAWYGTRPRIYCDLQRRTSWRSSIGRLIALVESCPLTIQSSCYAGTIGLVRGENR